MTTQSQWKWGRHRSGAIVLYWGALLPLVTKLSFEYKFFYKAHSWSLSSLQSFWQNSCDKEECKDMQSYRGITFNILLNQRQSEFWWICIWCVHFVMYSSHTLCVRCVTCFLCYVYNTCSVIQDDTISFQIIVHPFVNVLINVFYMHTLYEHLPKHVSRKSTVILQFQ